MSNMAFNYSKLRGKIYEKFRSQTEFAKALKTNDKAVTMVLTRKRFFRDYEIVEWCKLLGIDKSDIPEYFFAVEFEKCGTD